MGYPVIILLENWLEVQATLNPLFQRQIGCHITRVCFIEYG